MQPDVTMAQVLYWGVSIYSFSVTTARNLYQGASTRRLDGTTAWILYQGAIPYCSALPFGSAILR